MGTGKSSAAITYINEHPERKFIYITPYIEEATRIKNACPDLHFYAPQKLPEYHGSKVMHTLDLVRDGVNVATTHQAFKYYPQELLDIVREKDYVLIIDENVDVLESVEENAGDIQVVIDAQCLSEYKPNTYSTGEKKYKGAACREVFRLLKTRDLIKVTADNEDSYFYWQLPPQLITAFNDVYVLTYMFSGQGLHHFFKLYDIPFEYIGVEHPDDATYRFCDTGCYVPPYVKDIKEKIHILDNAKLNKVGNERTALSMSWFQKNPEKVKQLKNNIYNYFRNVTKSKSPQRLWCTYVDSEKKIKGKGYSNAFTPFNLRATNKYCDKNVLALCVNLYMNVGQKLLYHRMGVDVNEDAYALSTMVQWIWRSAIRNGEEIWIYIPSKRMRTLLTDWIEEVSKLGEM